MLSITWLEKDDGLHAGKLSRIDVELPELVEGVVQLHQGGAEGAGQVRELTGGEESGGGEGQTPLNRAQQEQL